MSGKKLRLKDLTQVHFTAAPDDVDGMYIDPVSGDVLRNSSKLVVLKPTGDIVLEKTYQKCIKADGSFKGLYQY
jgi:nitric oxide synthase-interacting protein